METQHIIYTGFAQNMNQISDSSVDMIITSPPYPMIEMWDEIMCQQNPDIKQAFEASNGELAFELMHKELDKVWQECFRVLKEGGNICINIGDATRTIGGSFALYSNHSRIIMSLSKIGFINLPNIIWRKQTNAPNKFMGSGMLPAGAYVTLEHEWILVFRKGNKRMFKSDDAKKQRRNSSFFWEERNAWFSDIWDIKGTRQFVVQSKNRNRSAAYPFEIPYRLINMYSLQGDTILDPFMGTGTTALAAMITNRNSKGYEIDSDFVSMALKKLQNTSIQEAQEVIDNRILAHAQFIAERTKLNLIKHFNPNINMPVMTSQETDIRLFYLSSVKNQVNTVIANYVEANKLKNKISQANTVIAKTACDLQMSLFKD